MTRAGFLRRLATALGAAALIHPNRILGTGVGSDSRSRVNPEGTTSKVPLFGEWLANEASGTGLRLVIEEMNQSARMPCAGRAVLLTVPDVAPQVSFSSGAAAWPWCGSPQDSNPAITWRFAETVKLASLQVQPPDENHWIRRYRVELTEDGKSWRVICPSRLLDSYHRQPFRLSSQLNALESSLLPEGRGTEWANCFFEDFLCRTVEELGPDSAYPDLLSGEYFLSAAASPFAFAGVYNSGDCGNFDALIAVMLSPQLGIESQRIFPDLIHHFGFMPGVMGPGKDDTAFALDYSGTTWGPCCYWDLLAWTRDRRFMAWFADSCAEWARWWRRNRDRNGDGWLEPGVNGCKPSTADFRKEQAARHPELARRCPDFWDYVGLHNSRESAMQLAIWEEPWDDNPRFVVGRHRGLRFDPKTLSLNIHFIETQLYISLLNSFVADCYRRLGKPEAAAYAQEGERLLKLVADNCWDEETGFYYDCDADTGERRTFVKHVGAFVAMMMGLPTMDQASRMVQHLTNPKEFWTRFPVPTISLDSPDYLPTGYWSGRAWPPTNFFVLRALLNYGFFDEADELLERWVRHTRFCMEGQSIPGGPQIPSAPDVRIIVPENWNPETGDVAEGSGGLTWGGLWLPAVVFRNFWPLGEHSAILRPGGRLRLSWAHRWNVAIHEDRVRINGCIHRLSSRASYLLDESTGELRPLEAGKADPVVLSRLGLRT